MPLAVPAPRSCGASSRAKIPPTLEGAARQRANGHEFRIEQHDAAWRAVVLRALLEAREFLPAGDDALHHPVERAAREQFVLAFRRLERGVIGQRRLARLLARGHAALLPIGKILDGVRPDAELDHVQGHEWIVAPPRAPRNRPIHSLEFIEAFQVYLAVHVPAYWANTGAAQNTEMARMHGRTRSRSQGPHRRWSSD